MSAYKSGCDNNSSFFFFYHALTRIFTSPSWSSGIAFLPILSLLRPPKPVRMTARISLASPDDSALSASLPAFLLIMHSVSSVISAPSLAMSETRCSPLLSSPRLAVMWLQPAHTHAGRMALHSTTWDLPPCLFCFSLHTVTRQSDSV